MKSRRRIIYSLKIPEQSLRIPGLFSSRYRGSTAPITRLSNRLLVEESSRSARRRLDRKSLSCLCISQRDTLSDSSYTAHTDKVYMDSGNSRILTAFQGLAMPTTRFASVTEPSNFPQDGHSWPPIHVAVLTTVEIYIYTYLDAHARNTVTDV